jgi:hypothetical protein
MQEKLLTPGAVYARRRARTAARIDPVILASTVRVDVWNEAGVKVMVAGQSRKGFPVMQATGDQWSRIHEWGKRGSVDECPIPPKVIDHALSVGARLESGGGVALKSLDVPSGWQWQVVPGGQIAGLFADVATEDAAKAAASRAQAREEQRNLELNSKREVAANDALRGRGLPKLFVQYATRHESEPLATVPLSLVEDLLKMLD